MKFFSRSFTNSKLNNANVLVKREMLTICMGATSISTVERIF